MRIKQLENDWKRGKKQKKNETEYYDNYGTLFLLVAFFLFSSHFPTTLSSFLPSRPSYVFFLLLLEVRS